MDLAAAVLVLDGCPSADPGANHIGGRSRDGFDDEGAGCMGDPGSNEGRGVVGWQGTWREARSSGPGGREPVEAEAAPVVAVDVVGNEVPVAAEPDQPVWLDTAFAAFVISRGVVEMQTLSITAGLGCRGERLRINTLDGRGPRGGLGGSAQVLDPMASDLLVDDVRAFFRTLWPIR